MLAWTTKLLFLRRWGCKILTCMDLSPSSGGKWQTRAVVPKLSVTVPPTEISHLHKYSDPLLSTLFKHLQQQLKPWVFLGMMLQAWHTCIWGVSPIILCNYSSSVRLDGEPLCTAIFRSLQRCLVGFKSGLWLEHSRTFRDLSKATPALS